MPDHHQNTRFYSQARQGVFLHLEDAPAIARVRLAVMRYDRGGLTRSLDYYLTRDEARLLFHRLVAVGSGVHLALRSGVPGKVRELHLDATGDQGYPLRLSLSATPAVPSSIAGVYRPRRGARKVVERLLFTADQAASLGLAGQEHLLVQALVSRLALGAGLAQSTLMTKEGGDPDACNNHPPAGGPDRAGRSSGYPGLGLRGDCL